LFSLWVHLVFSDGETLTEKLIFLSVLVLSVSVNAQKNNFWSRWNQFFCECMTHRKSVSDGELTKKLHFSITLFPWVVFWRYTVRIFSVGFCTHETIRVSSSDPRNIPTLLFQKLLVLSFWVFGPFCVRFTFVFHVIVSTYTQK
jgi:hypothetical protein